MLVLQEQNPFIDARRSAGVWSCNVTAQAFQLGMLMGTGGNASVQRKSSHFVHYFYQRFVWPAVRQDLQR